MFTSIFIVAVVISAFFDRQQRRHRLELQIEYERLGKKMPSRADATSDAGVCREHCHRTYTA